jgi:Glycosyltransferases involved in cell wall biogenesis
MIVKDEEEYLANCLASIKDIVSEIIVVDTGSSDNTVSIAKSYNAKVYYHKWNNSFSEARNESLKYATKDWILIMDADEELSSESKISLKKLLDTSLDKNAIYMFQTLSYYGDSIESNSLTINLNPRLFKNNESTHYEGEIHNQLIYLEDKYCVMCEDIKLNHYGYLNKSVNEKNKRTRNIELLNSQIEKDPDNYFAHFNLGTEYAALNDTEKALMHLYKSYEKFDANNGYSYLLIFRIAFLNYNIKDYDTAFKFINIGLECYPKFTELYFLKSLIYKDMNMPTKQIRELEKCIELGESPLQYRCIFGVGGFKSYYELGDVYLKLRDYDTAYNYYDEAIKLKPDFINPLYSIGHILKNKNTPMNDFKKIIEQLFSDYPKSNAIIADLFYSEGFYKTALEYILKCEQAGMKIDELILLKAKCFVRIGEFNECIKLENVDEKNNSYICFIMHKVISAILTNNYKNASALLDDIKEGDLSQHNKKLLKVYYQCLNIFKGEQVSDISTEENETEYLGMIIDICGILLINNKFEELKTAVNLLNLINNKAVLLELGKLYYKYGYIELAKKEIMRSIKEFEVYDREGLEILMR